MRALHKPLRCGNTGRRGCVGDGKLNINFGGGEILISNSTATPATWPIMYVPRRRQSVRPFGLTIYLRVRDVRTLEYKKPHQKFEAQGLEIHAAHRGREPDFRVIRFEASRDGAATMNLGFN